MAIDPTLAALLDQLDHQLADATATASSIRATCEKIAGSIPSTPPVDPPSTPPTLTAFTFLQWNTHHGGLGSDGKYDPDRFCNAITPLDPDVISLNEIENAAIAKGFVSRIQQRLGNAWGYGYDGKGNVLTGGLARLVDYKVYTLNPAAARVCSAATLAIAGRSFTVASVHLDSVSGPNRVIETKAIVALKLDIVCGDFNMQVGSSEYVQMTAEYVDVWAAAKAAGTSINVPGNCDGCTKSSRIDYVWVRKTAPIQIVQAEVLDPKDDKGITPSDHRPLLVRLTL